MLQIVRGIEQGTTEWHELRLGRMTASHAQEIANCGKGLDTLCRKIAGQIFTNTIAPSYKNENMIIGNEEEHYAREAYEILTGNDVEQVTFGIYSDYVGASPDGLVGTDGGIEIKRKTFEKHCDLLFGVEPFESKYIWQCRMNMLVFDRQWWDLLSYNPLFKGKSLFKLRLHREEQYDEQLLKGFEKGENLIKKYLSILDETTQLKLE
jgi:hypothetical protein